MIAGMAFLVFRRREFQARTKAMGIVRIGINFLQLVRCFTRVCRAVTMLTAERVDVLQLVHPQNAALGSYRLHGSSVVRNFLSWR